MGAVASRSNCFDLAALALCGLLVKVVRSSRKTNMVSGVALPPGPKRLPIIGNTLDMPWRDDHLTLTHWGEQYGEIVFVSLLGGQNVVYLNSSKAASDLLEKRRNYSDRPPLPLLSDSVDCSWNFGLSAYGDNWRLHRKLFASKFGIQRAINYVGIQERSMKKFLRSLIQTPEAFIDHVELHTARQIMKVVYDFDIETKDDKFLHYLHEGMRLVSEATRPVAFLIKSIPFMKQFHSFWPGALGEYSPAQMRDLTQKMTSAPFAAAMDRMAREDCVSSVVSELMDQHSAASEQVIQNVAAVAYTAGAETTAAFSEAFILAMVLFPEVQQKAQAEIDRVIGANRLPTVEDKDDLPYIYAVFLEAFRWHTVTPQGTYAMSFIHILRHKTLTRRAGVPHRLLEDDEYLGYFIPSGTTVIPNTWGILHDPVVYPDPMAFKPERYFSTDGKLDLSADPRKIAFGFGRRICAGMHFAENSVWIFIAQMLASMNISHKIDERGRKVEARLKPMMGIVTRPEPFQCSILPRSKQAKDLIMSDE